MLLDKGKAQTKYIKRMLFNVGGQAALNPETADSLCLKKYYFSSFKGKHISYLYIKVLKI